jgi:succinoglycan biosynthesis protein ExoA
MTTLNSRPAPLVSIIVPVRDEEKNLPACLRSLFNQTFTDSEILVVDGRSSDATRAVARELAATSRVPVRIVDNPQRTIPHALNLAASAARGALLVRVDGHSTVPATYVEQVVQELQSGAWAGVGGRKVAAGSSHWARAFTIAFGSRAAGGALYHHGTERVETDHVPFGAYPRYVVTAVGGWDEGLLVNQDYEFDHRVRAAGGRILFLPELEISWRAREKPCDIAYQYARYGEGKVRVLLKHPDSLRLRQLASPLMLGGLVAGAATALRTRRLMPLAPYAIYLIATAGAGASAGLRRKAEWRTLVRVPAVLLVMHHAWGYGFFRGVCRALRQPRGTPGDQFRSNPVGPDGMTNEFVSSRALAG